MKEEDDDELILFIGVFKNIYKIREIKFVLVLIEKGVYKSKSRGLVVCLCCNNIFFVLLDDEGSLVVSDEFYNKENFFSLRCNVMVKKLKIIYRR